MYNQHLELLVKMRCDIGCLQRTSHKGYQSITTQSTRAVAAIIANRSWIHHRNSLYPACQSIQSNPIHSRFLRACLSFSHITFVRKLSTKVPIPPSSTVEKYWDDVMLNSNYPGEYYWRLVISECTDFRFAIGIQLAGFTVFPKTCQLDHYNLDCFTLTSNMLLLISQFGF